MLLGKTRHQFSLRLGDKSKNPRQYLYYSVNLMRIIDSQYHMIWHCP